MATILIVDDFAPSQRLMRYILHSADHQVVIAANGSEALDQLFSRAIDMVITDWYMPTMNGRTFVQRVRADARFHGLPIVVLTASGDEQDAAKAEAVGVTAFLTKPIASEKLLATVQNLLAALPDFRNGHDVTEPESPAMLTVPYRSLT